MNLSIKHFVDEFHSLTNFRPVFDPDYLAAVERLVAYLQTRSLLPMEQRSRRFLGHTNWKFRLNADSLGTFYSEAARLGYTFHYHHKFAIQRAFDLNDSALLRTTLIEKGLPDDIIHKLERRFTTTDPEQTVKHLHAECEAPRKLRKEQGDRDIKAEILKALFGAFMWCSLPEREMHEFFDPHYCHDNHRDSFWDQLHQRLPGLFNRDHTLHILHVGETHLRSSVQWSDVRSSVLDHVRQAYNAINNYGFLAVLLDHAEANNRTAAWEAAADVTLYAEKHRSLPLDKAYFRWTEVQTETLAFIPGIDRSAARFDLVNEGFTYRDCFVLSTNGDGTIRQLLLIFQKNERDETLIQCPTCRSTDVQGNSYSSLGVRSWECNNPLCPDRSKYNRGKRYSFRGLVMQQAIEDERSEISVESVRQWARDVVTGVSDEAVLQMLLRHYSIYGDTVHVCGVKVEMTHLIGRRIVGTTFGLSSDDGESERFWAGPFFHRYVQCNAPQGAPQSENLGTDRFQVFNGNSAHILRSFPEAFFDGAVTSPPYYNARDYAQWPNMYCYLNEMLRVNSEVYRVLKPGTLYLYNIFDYFDNERTVVFSAMGQKRMILSAYTVDLFRRIGFECVGNIVWDKGDIEGKRGFNAGNFSPYYQAPFNCWEHILIFRKPQEVASVGEHNSHSFILRQQPVIKMVRGENIHGHSAPFPDAIPELLIKGLRAGAWVLDPFGGSLTTGRVAHRHGLGSVCIEQSEEYCRLGMRMKDEEERVFKEEEKFRQQQLNLFG